MGQPSWKLWKSLEYYRLGVQLDYSDEGFFQVVNRIPRRKKELAFIAKFCSLSKSNRY